MGCLALPFIDQGGAGVTDGRKRKKQNVEKVLRGAGSFFSLEPTLLTWQTMLGIAHSLILTGLGFGLVSASGHVPSPSGWCGVSGHRAMTLWGVDEEVTIRSLLLMM